MAGGPIASFKWAWKKMNSTVINSLWPELWFFSLFALAVCLINMHTKVKFQLSTTLLTVLGTVLGLVISFRTTSAYDRYWEGRKLWGSIALASRNLGMIIWIQVPLKRKAKDGAQPLADVQLRSLIERKTMINLVQAYSVSVKHYLRSEPGIFYEDLYPLLSFLPQNLDHEDTDDRGANGSNLPMWQMSVSPHTRLTERKPKKARTFDPESVLPQSDVPLAPARNPPKDTIYDIFPPFIVLAPIHILFKKFFGRRRGDVGTRNIFGKKKEAEPIESNIPLEISLFLSSYLQMCIAEGLLAPAIATAFQNALTSLQDAVTNLERIRTTPIPFAYQAHLRVSVWMYLLFIPLEIYSTFKWLTIPATAFVTFLYLGFLEIGQEIENPFNYDENDLDLDHFCLQIQRELSEITAHPAPEPSSYIFSRFNQPFAPADRRNAATILRDRNTQGSDDVLAVKQVRHTLLQNYVQIQDATIKKKTPSRRQSLNDVEKATIGDSDSK